LIGDGGTLYEGLSDALDIVLAFRVFSCGDAGADVWDKCAFWVGGSAKETPLAIGVRVAGLNARPCVSLVCQCGS
jgi:hypothetical protein